MLTLYFYPLCPFSRSVRLLLAESGIDVQLVEENPWDWREDFLALNPSGRLPVLDVQDGPTLCGAYAISEYLDDTQIGAEQASNRFRPFPGGAPERAEVRRLVDWFHGKFDAEVSAHIFDEKITQRFAHNGARAPDIDVLRAGFENLDYHMRYINHLGAGRSWLAGAELSFADFAAAGHVSFIDYLDDISWGSYPHAKEWFARLKSRPAYRAILADKVGWLKPPAHYADPDF